MKWKHCPIWEMMPIEIDFKNNEKMKNKTKKPAME